MKDLSKHTLETLRRLEEATTRMGDTMARESKVYDMELQERQRLGLHGDAAVQHYNDWMDRYNMAHLKVKL